MDCSIHRTCVGVVVYPGGNFEFKMSASSEAHSAEPGRKVAYSRDIIWRVIWQRLGMGLTFRSIASRLQIAVGTGHRIFQQFIKTGEVEPLCKRKERPATRKLDDLHEVFILNMVADNPGLYLSEMTRRIHEATNTAVNCSTLCRLLRRNGHTRKKIVQVAKQRRTDFRALYMAHISHYKKEFLVFVDEMGSDKRDGIRKFGYAPVGQAPMYRRWLVRGQRTSAVAAICCDGVIAYKLMTGTNNGKTFLEFVQGVLIPEMSSFDGISERSIVVLDNCSIHHTQEVMEAFQQASIMVIFLPPYSPNFMPIEICYAYVKQYLKDHDVLMQAIQDPSIIIESAFNSVTKQQCINWINKCHYD